MHQHVIHCHRSAAHALCIHANAKASLLIVSIWVGFCQAYPQPWVGYNLVVGTMGEDLKDMAHMWPIGKSTITPAVELYIISVSP